MNFCLNKDSLSNNLNYPQASEAVSLDLFNTGASNLLGKTKDIQEKKQGTMTEILAKIGPKLEQVEPVTEVELKPFLDAMFPN